MTSASVQQAAKRSSLPWHAKAVTASQQAHQVRDTLCQYFNSEGSLDGQESRSLEL